MRAIEIFGSLSNVAPVFDYVNIDNLVTHLAEIVGVPELCATHPRHLGGRTDGSGADAV